MRFTLEKFCLLLAASASLFFTSMATAENIKDFAGFSELASKNSLACTACHQQDTKTMGPSFNAIALYYKDKKDAAAMLEKKILAGGSGVWSGTMPANPTAKNQAGDMVKWILSLKPEGDAKTKAEAEIKK
jgi:cytochrome c551/c552